MVVWPPETPYADRNGLWVCVNEVCKDGIHVQMLRPFEPVAAPAPAPAPAAAALPGAGEEL